MSKKKKNLVYAFTVLYTSSFLMASVYIWLASVQYYLELNKTSPALWLFFCVPVGFVFLFINNLIVRFMK